MKNILRPVLLLAATLALLTACDPGTNGIVEPTVKGTVIGYTGPKADVVLYALNPAGESFEYFPVGSGTVEGSTIEFTIDTPPDEALYPASAMYFLVTEPEPWITTLVVQLADDTGGFELANTDPHKGGAEWKVGDAVAHLMYADRAGTLTVPDWAYDTDGMTGKIIVREGWNVVRSVVTKIDGGLFEQRLGNGDLASLDWYFVNWIVH